MTFSSDRLQSDTFPNLPENFVQNFVENYRRKISFNYFIFIQKQRFSKSAETLF